jgi:PleD family two-component response regulator
MGLSMRTLTLAVLLVEDHEPDAFTVTRFAEQLNRNEWQRNGQAALSLHRATRLSEALELLKTKDFDAILTDLTLPDSFALHTYKSIAAQSPETPVVILTGAEDDELAARAIAEGAQDYLQKADLAPETLWRALRFARERQRMLNALRDSTFVDGLTGMYSRLGFLRVADDLLDATAQAGPGLTLLVAEISNLPQIAQKTGCPGADLAVLEFAEVLRRSARSPRLLARLEQAVFAMLALSDVEPAVRLQQSLEEYHQRQRPAEPLQVRIGTVRGDSGIEEMLLQARIHLQARVHAYA